MSTFIPGDVVRTASGKADRIVTTVDTVGAGVGVRSRVLKNGEASGREISSYPNTLTMVTAAPRVVLPTRKRRGYKTAAVWTRRARNRVARASRRKNRQRA
jgi:hypothetical protein